MSHDINTASSLITVSILNAFIAGKTPLSLIKKSSVLEFEYKFIDRSIITINLIIEFKE
jgi:hypothetical protein